VFFVSLIRFAKVLFFFIIMSYFFEKNILGGAGRWGRGGIRGRRRRMERASEAVLAKGGGGMERHFF